MPKLDNYEQEIDALIGDRIRARRVELGLSQADLAAMISMSFQQVQKYERGSNRIASSILLRIASALDCPPGFFLDIDQPGRKKATKKAAPENAADREMTQLFQRLREIKSPKARGRITLVLDALLREAENAAPQKRARAASGKSPAAKTKSASARAKK